MGKQKIDLPELVDRAGELDAQLKRISEDLAATKEIIKENLKLGETLTGAKYQASLSQRTAYILDIKKVQKKLDPKDFLEVASVSMTELKKVMLKEDIDKCVAETKISETLSIKAR